MLKRIYAIYDNVAEAIIGGLHLHSNAAPAIRMFGDVALMPNSSVQLHPSDFDLIQLGTIQEDGTITESTRTLVLTGATWAAAQTQPEK